MKSLPTISVVIPTYNEERNIGNCLESIFKQNYPKQNLEIIVVDDKSTDRTLTILKNFPVKVLTSGARHGEISKMIGFKKAKGELAIYLDADIELRGNDWFVKMVKPLIENSEVIGSFTRYFTRQDDPAIERYLTFDPLQRDSIYQFFSPAIEDTISENKNGYFLCRYNLNKIPPAGLCLYRRKELLKLVNNFTMFLELDFLVVLVKNGFNTFAYAPEAGLYHHHANSLIQLIKKRKYNLTKVYFAHAQNKLYTWFDLSKPAELFKILIWVVYANLFLPSIIVGVFKFIKHRDLAGMYEPLVNLMVTDSLIYNFLTNSSGIKVIKNAIFKKDV